MNQFSNGDQESSKKPKFSSNKQEVRSKFSIVIPTSGNPLGVKRLLSSLSLINDRQFEVIVIDNGDKKTCWKEFLAFKKKDFFYFHTKRKGASIARNEGIKRAKFPFILFLDDDVEVKPEILKAYDEAWQENKDYTLLGGATNSIKISKSPLTAEEKKLRLKYGWIFAHRCPNQDKEIKINDLLFSANFSMRKKDNYYFSESLGVIINPNIFLGAEDYELCTRILLSGGKIKLLSDKRMKVNHWIDSSRFSKKYLLYRGCLAGIELLFMEKILTKSFGAHDFYLLKRVCSFKDMLRIFFDPVERMIFLSYIINRNVFGK